MSYAPKLSSPVRLEALADLRFIWHAAITACFVASILPLSYPICGVFVHTIDFPLSLLVFLSATLPRGTAARGQPCRAAGVSTVPPIVVKRQAPSTWRAPGCHGGSASRCGASSVSPAPVGCARPRRRPRPIPSPDRLAVLADGWPFAVHTSFCMIYYQIATYCSSALLGRRRPACLVASFLIPGTVFHKYLLARIHRWSEHEPEKLMEVYRVA